MAVVIEAHEKRKNLSNSVKQKISKTIKLAKVTILEECKCSGTDKIVDLSRAFLDTRVVARNKMQNFSFTGINSNFIEFNEENFYKISYNKIASQKRVGRNV